MNLTHVSLFSGIGGFDLAAQSAGFVNSAEVEINPFADRFCHYDSRMPESLRMLQPLREVNC